jgi:aminoglycoside phosphotransferase (APT) family kinase protein
VLGRDFSLSRRAPGVAAGHILVRDEGLGGPRPALLARLGAELARMQTIAPPCPALDILPQPAPSPALAAIREFQSALDGHGAPRPALEWGLRWLELNAPPAGDLVLVHGDFRTGNFLVDADGLCGILDWEFARWGDPLEDVGWFTARCWRFGRYDRPAGGLGPLADFERGYREASGRELPARAVHYWQVMAHARWAVIAMHQGERHASGRRPSLELALTGRIPDELELELLTLIEEAERGIFDG